MHVVEIPSQSVSRIARTQAGRKKRAGRDMGPLRTDCVYTRILATTPGSELRGRTAGSTYLSPRWEFFTLFFSGSGAGRGHSGKTGTPAYLPNLQHNPTFLL